MLVLRAMTSKTSKTPRTPKASVAIAALSLWCGLSLVYGQTYPVKPVRIVVPFAAGGGSDVTARLASEKLAAAFGHPVIVENRPGASGNIGIRFVAKSPADGYTVLVMSSNFSINPVLYASAGYDPLKDFEPVSGLTSYMFYLVCHPSLPVRSIKALIALARAQPGKLSYSSAGVATGGHLAAEMFNSATGARLVHVPYKGVGPAIYDTIAGQVPIMFAVPEVVPQVRAGKLVVLGVTGATRSVSLPSVPTIAESGLPNYELSSWHAMFAPLGTPEAIVKRLNAELHKGLSHREVLEHFRQKDMNPAFGTPQALTALVKETYAKQSKVIRDAGIRME